VYGLRLGESAHRFPTNTDAKNADNEPHGAPGKLGDLVIHNKTPASTETAEMWHERYSKVAATMLYLQAREAL
jgi:hypothetical protein